MDDQDGKMRQPRNSLILRNVAYRIIAWMDLRADEPGEEIGKHLACYERRVSSGGFHHKPCLGCREFSADFAAFASEDIPVKREPEAIDDNFGTMLFDTAFMPTGDEMTFYRHMKGKRGIISGSAKRLFFRGRKLIVASSKCHKAAYDEISELEGKRWDSTPLLMSTSARFGSVLPSGFKKASQKTWLIQLNVTGSPAGVPTKAVDFPHLVPKAPAGRTSGVVATLVVDKASYALGIGGDSSRIEHARYLKLLRRCRVEAKSKKAFTGSSSETLAAIYAFQRTKLGRGYVGIGEDDIIVFLVGCNPYLFSDPQVCRWLRSVSGGKAERSKYIRTMCGMWRTLLAIAYC